MQLDHDWAAVFENRETIGGDPYRRLALDCLAAGIRAAHPEHVLQAKFAQEGSAVTIDGTRYNLDDFERVEVIGAGKAAGVIARALEQRLGEWIDRGVVVTSHPQDTSRIEQVEGAHPLPDQQGTQGGAAVRERAAAGDGDTLLMVILTGGGSALLPVPAEPIPLAALREVTTALLDAGASIDELNTVRKHLSAVKGGRLAGAAAPATVVGLLMSDVVGNEPSVIASGPLSPDETTYSDALEILDTYDVNAPEAVAEYLRRGREGGVPETPGQENQVFEDVSLHILADNETALSGAAQAATQQGYSTEILTERIEGEARTVGQSHAETALNVLSESDPVSPPAVLLAGGETTVTVRGDGRGGPNQEVAIGAGLRLSTSQAGPVVVASVDTDGIDGTSDAAGGLVDASTVEDPAAAEEALETNDSSEYLATRNGLLVTGFTGTNVNDLHLIVVGDTGGE